eukprot:CAMPEP_0114692994 /NCGR_PEP_ID=MMETSP0191-20121206/68564_1 /TAXON_ID=126664 /ORGANISM="Sorites sp." /LENGTH=264 /DNA_ID=CAMNT_0001986093 /DNA_START=341 /DNA_END=1135 /DNA_ORIENTATION=-
MDCLKGNISAIPIDNHPIDPCGKNMSNDYVLWRCLEKGIYTDSINLIDLVYTDRYWDVNRCPSSPLIAGPDTDLAAVAIYEYNTNKYVAGLSKAGMFYVWNIPNLELQFSKKIGPWSELGGGHFSLAIDESNMIAVAHITGNPVYFQRLSDGIPYCGGVIFGIDLITGKTIYEIPQPWAVFGDICQNFKPGEKDATLADFIDYSVINSGLCVSNITEDIVSVKNFDISDIRGINETLIPFAKATFYAPVTVSNGLLYIPSATGC